MGRTGRSISIAGAGVAGLCCAYELARRGCAVTIYEAGATLGANSCSRFAGGMLAPFCERESAEEAVVTLGRQALDWWARVTPVTRAGTLVVAPPRDASELTRFARRTTNHIELSVAALAEREPDLGGRFRRALFFAEEGHLDPRAALADLAKALRDMGVEFRFGARAPANATVHCTGMAANLPGLRAVRGEMALLHCPEVRIERAVRLLHPRVPVYLVPRGAGLYMIGATMVESDATRPPTLRSLMELLGAAFTLHPGFAEASVVETGAGLRPAFPDNLPRIVEQDGSLHLNGLYRHGFLLAPAMAARLADRLLSEETDEHHAQCATL